MVSNVVPALALAAAAEAFAITTFFPHYLPHNPFVWTLLRTAAANLTLFILYHVVLYPFFLSPLRHLPSPTVGLILTNLFSVPRLIISKGRFPSDWSWPCYVC
jgi:hypothetical protein